MGLPGTPKIEGKNIGSKNRIKNMPYALQEMLGLTKTKKQEDKTHVDKIMSKKNAGVTNFFCIFLICNLEKKLLRSDL